MSNNTATEIPYLNATAIGAVPQELLFNLQLPGKHVQMDEQYCISENVIAQRHFTREVVDAFNGKTVENIIYTMRLNSRLYLEYNSVENMCFLHNSSSVGSARATMHIMDVVTLDTLINFFRA